MSPVCIQNVSRVYLERIHNVSRMYPECILWKPTSAYFIEKGLMEVYVRILSHVTHHGPCLCHWPKNKACNCDPSSLCFLRPPDWAYLYCTFQNVNQLARSLYIFGRVLSFCLEQFWHFSWLPFIWQRSRSGRALRIKKGTCQAFGCSWEFRTNINNLEKP